MELITRAEAKAQGLKHYFTGQPCNHGHVAERYVSSKICHTCHAAIKATYYKANTEIIAAKAAKYRKANADIIAAKAADYYRANAETIAAKHAIYRRENTATDAATAVAYRRANAATLAAKAAIYAKENPHLRNAINAKRRATKLQATPSWANLEAIKAIYEQATFLSKVLGVQQHVDHIIPLQGKTVCGLHVHYNLQILDASDNIKKSNKVLLEFETLETAV